MITVITKLPSEYPEPIASKMEEAGLEKIEIDFWHNDEWTRGSFAGTRYVFNDKVITDVKKFKKRVYGYE